MMTLLIFTIGIVLGWVLSSLYYIKHTSNGYFTIEPYDEEETGFYRVNMRIPLSEQDGLMNKERLILYREYSQK